MNDFFYSSISRYEPSELEKLVQKEKIQQIKQAVIQIANTTDRDIAQYYLDGLTFAQIGNKLHMPESQIENRFQGVMTLLRNSLEKVVD